jgi:hypothetical protein
MNSIPIPSFPHRFATLQEAITAIQDHGRQNGYGMVVRRSTKHMKDKTLVQRCYLECDRHNHPASQSQSAGLRQSGSRQIGCLFRIVLRWRPGHTAYEVDISDAPHNHTPSLDPKAHPVHRNRELISSSTSTSQLKSGPYSTSAINSLHNPAVDTIDNLSQLGLAPRIITAAIQRQQPDITLTDRDIYNYRARLRR